MISIWDLDTLIIIIDGYGCEIQTHWSSSLLDMDVRYRHIDHHHHYLIWIWDIDTLIIIIAWSGYKINKYWSSSSLLYMDMRKRHINNHHRWIWISDRDTLIISIAWYKYQCVYIYYPYRAIIMISVSLSYIHIK